MMEDRLRFLLAVPEINALYQTSQLAPKSVYGQIKLDDLQRLASLLVERRCGDLRGVAAAKS